MKRAVVLFGAGASFEYGGPLTLGLTDTIEREVRADSLMQKTGGDVAYLKILAGLKSYLQKPGIVHFEQIYHCVHELIYTFPPTTRAFDEFRPLLLPFINNSSQVPQDALRPLAQKIVEVIYSEVSGCCKTPTVSLTPHSRISSRGSGRITSPASTRRTTTISRSRLFPISTPASAQQERLQSLSNSNPFGRRRTKIRYFTCTVPCIWAFSTHFRQVPRLVIYFGSTNGLMRFRMQCSLGRTSGVWTEQVSCVRPS